MPSQNNSEWITPTGGGSSSGSSTGQQPSGGGNIYTWLEIQQVASETAGTIRIRIRPNFFSAPYYGASVTYDLRVYLGSSSSGTLLASASKRWNRPDTGYKTVQGSWLAFDIANSSSTYVTQSGKQIPAVKIYAECSPTEYYPAAGFNLTVTNVKKSYTFEVQADESITSYKYTITDASKINGSNRSNLTAQTALVYDGDKIAWSATPKAGRKLDPVSGTITITGNYILTLAAQAMATIHIMVNKAWQLYSVYIRKNGTWQQYQANVRKTGSWQQYC